LKPS